MTRAWPKLGGAIRQCQADEAIVYTGAVLAGKWYLIGLFQACAQFFRQILFILVIHFDES